MKSIIKLEELYSRDIKKIIETDKCTVYKLENESGDGIITNYKVFQGIDVCYNDIHMEYSSQGEKVVNYIMEINHCREGRFECELRNGTHVYLEAGDLSVNILSNRSVKSYFPIAHYNGISITISMYVAAKVFPSIFNDVTVDIQKIRDELCPHNNLFIMRANESIQHIFSELYTVPDEIKNGYLKLKVLELLLFLSVFNSSKKVDERQYYHKSKVEKIKVINKYMIDNLDQHFTLYELSEKFQMPLTTMKLCFKGVYSKSIYAYLKAYKMQEAAKMLKGSNETITSIAQRVGYENAGKFSRAFKNVINILPSEYRKKYLNGSSMTEWRSK